LIQSSFIEGIPQVTVFIDIIKVNMSLLEKNNFITVKTGHELKPKVIMSHGIGKIRFQPKLKQRLFCL